MNTSPTPTIVPDHSVSEPALPTTMARHARPEQAPPSGPTQQTNPGQQKESTTNQGHPPKRNGAGKPQGKSRSQSQPTGPLRGDKDGSEESSRPESAQIFLWLWLAALVVELIHQVLNIVIAVWDPAELRAQVSQSMEDGGQSLSDGVLNLGVYGAIAFSGAVALTMLAVLATMVYLFYRNNERAGLGRRLLFFFGLYFTFRLLLIFSFSPSPTSEVPQVFYLVDGNLQILVGVLAALTLYFGGRKDTLDYTGETEQLRQWEKEFEAERERKAQLKAEKKARKKTEADDKDRGKSKKPTPHKPGDQSGHNQRATRPDANTDTDVIPQQQPHPDEETTDRASQ